MSQTILSEQNFHKQLVHRFFHPNSYFYHCIQSELEIVLSQLYGPEKDHYLLLGNLLDKLVSASDSFQELQKLVKIPGFAEFEDKLTQGTRYLYSADIDTEGMKAEIEGLAHSMFNSALLAFQDEDSMRLVKPYLGVEEALPQPEFIDLPATEPPVGTPEPQANAAPTPQAADKAEEQNGLPNLSDEVEAPQEELPVAGLTGSLPKAVIPSPGSPVADLPPVRAEIDQEPGTLVGRFRDEITNKLNELGGLLKPAYDEREWKRASDEIFDVIDAIGMAAMIYGFEAFEQLALKTRKRLHGLQRTGQATQAMVSPLVCGFKNAGDSLLLGDPEKVDVKTVKSLTDQILGGKNTPAVESGVERSDAVSLPETPSVELTARQIEHTPVAVQPEEGRVEDQVSRSDASAVLFDLESTDIKPAEVRTGRDLQSEDAEQEASIASSPPKDVWDEDETRESGMDEMETMTSVDEYEGVTGFEAEDGGFPSLDKGDEDFKLPGEDDQEILDLIAEISSPDDESNASDVEIELSRAEAGFAGDDIDEKVDDFLALDYTTDPAANPDVPLLDTVGETSASDKAQAGGESEITVTSVDEDGESPLANFQKEARLYFSVMEEALTKLAERTADSTALEDIELAANALYSLARKQGLDRIEEFPASLASIAQQALARRNIATRDCRFLLKAIAEFRVIACLADLDQPHFTEIMSTVNSMALKGTRQNEPEINH